MMSAMSSLSSLSSLYALTVAAPLLFAPAPAPAQDAGDDEYEAVEGLDQETQQLMRKYEAKVERKVASDNRHIVAAYGVIWSLFAIYGVFLLVRTARQQRDLADLKKQLDTPE